jgi:ABC-type transport system substrate-binding protein
MVYNDGYTGLLGSPAVTLSYLTSATIPQTNYTFNYDADFDALYNQMLTASDAAEMQRLSAEADLYIIEHHWMVTILPSYSQIVVWQPWVKGYSGEILWEGCWAGALRARLWVDSSLAR